MGFSCCNFRKRKLKVWSKNTEDSWSCKRGQDKCILIDRALRINLTKLIRCDTEEQMKDRDFCRNIYVNAWQWQPMHTALMWVAFNILQGIVPMRVVKDEVHQDQAGSLVPKWFSGAQAPTIQCKACTTTSCLGAYNSIQYNACTATRCSGAYNTIQYNTRLGLRPGA